MDDPESTIPEVEVHEVLAHPASLGGEYIELHNPGTNSASIGGRARTVLEAEARWLKAHPDVKIKIIGRADDGGSGEDGKVLSAKRAEAVRDKLVEAGVPASRLGLEARGSGEPVATCKSALCQAQNRNVETLIAPAGEDFATSGEQTGKSGRKDAAVSDPAGRRALAR